jgi:glyoxylase-like metal-dependent hydrolase (beta-lactamase superfamily II)
MEYVLASQKIHIFQLPLGPLQTNCYLVGCLQTNEAAVIDPSWDGRIIYDKAQEEGWIIEKILLTHSHFDHVGGLSEIKELTEAPIYIHPEAEKMLEAAPLAANLWQITIPEPPQADHHLSAGQHLSVGKLQCQVLFTPGHAPGHVCFYFQEDNVLFDGDVLFQQSIGRTDLPGGDYALLIRSIREQLLDLPDETVVLSGHGPSTTIGQEKQWNPFLK